MSETKKKTKTATKKAKTTKKVVIKVPEEPIKVEKTPKMYVGPTIVGFAIQNRVYTEIPGAVGKVIRENPEIKNLFIEVKDYPKANKMLREEKGYIFSAYKKALEMKK